MMPVKPYAVGCGWICKTTRCHPKDSWLPKCRLTNCLTQIHRRSYERVEGRYTYTLNGKPSRLQGRHFGHRIRGFVVEDLIARSSSAQTHRKLRPEASSLVVVRRFHRNVFSKPGNIHINSTSYFSHYASEAIGPPPVAKVGFRTV